MQGAHTHRVFPRWFTPSRPLVARPLVKPQTTCESCGVITGGTAICPDCDERASPHHDGDPYDIIGGEGGGWA